MSVRVLSFTTFSNLIASAFLLAAAFPYVQIISNDSYTQPYAHILGMVLFVSSVGAFFSMRHSDLVSILSLAGVGLTLFVFTCSPWGNSQEYRYLMVYLSPFLMVPVFLNIIQKMPRQTVGILRYSIAIWLLVATVQVLVDAKFSASLLGRWGLHAVDIVSSGRGVLGLAPEPTHHGFHILVLGAVLSLLDDSKVSRILIFGCIVSAVFFAASSSAVLALLFSIGIWFIRYKTFSGLVVALIGGTILSYSSMMPSDLTGVDSRVIRLVRIFLDDPSLFLVSDYSVNVRLGGLWVVLSEVIRSGFFPSGLSHDAWLLARVGMLAKYDWLLALSFVGPPSGFGLLLFQGGLLTLPFLIVFMRRLFNNLPSTLLGQILVMAVPFIFLSQYYISSPLFSMIYACVIYKHRLKRTLDVRRAP